MGTYIKVFPRAWFMHKSDEESADIKDHIDKSFAYTVLCVVGLLFLYQIILIEPLYRLVQNRIPLTAFPYALFSNIITAIGIAYSSFALLLGVAAFLGIREFNHFANLEKTVERKNKLFQAGSYYSRGEAFYDEAWDVLQSMEDSNWEVCFYKGLIRHALGHPCEALGYYDRALSYRKTGVPNKNFAKIHANRGRLYNSMELYKEAFDDFEEALRIRTNYSAAINGKAFAQRRILGGKSGAVTGVQEALDIIETGIRTDRSFSTFYYNKACYLSQLGATSEALVALRKAVDLNATAHRSSALHDRDFTPLLQNPEFQGMVRGLPCL